MAPSLSTLAGALILGIAIYRWIIHPAFLSPLRRLPIAQWSSPYSRLWILTKRLQQVETLAVHEAHQRLGPVVRIAPNEVSINSPEGVRTVYGGAFPKNDWYANTFSNYGIQPMFAMAGNEPHGKRKRALGNVYAKSTLLSSPALEAISRDVVDDRLMPRLRDYAKAGEMIECYDIFFAVAMDYVTGYLFGLEASSKLVSQPDVAKRLAAAYKTRAKYVFLPQELPGLTRWMGRYGLLSFFLPPVAANQTLDWDSEAWVLKMQDTAESLVKQADKNSIESGQWPTVYTQLRESMLKERKPAEDDHTGSCDDFLTGIRLDIASEMVDHTFAGFDTGSIVLLYLAWELSKTENFDWQDKLRYESLFYSGDRTARDLDSLPILHAVIMETLRLHAPVPGNSVRVSPDRAVSFDNPGQQRVVLPPNTRIHAQAWSLHRDRLTFSDPERWDPDRWLNITAEQLRESLKWFWAFGSGSRMCAGNHFAMIELKRVASGIWRELKTELVDGRGMIHNGGFIGGPLGQDGNYLKLRLSAAEKA